MNNKYSSSRDHYYRDDYYNDSSRKQVSTRSPSQNKTKVTPDLNDSSNKTKEDYSPTTSTRFGKWGEESVDKKEDSNLSSMSLRQMEDYLHTQRIKKKEEMIERNKSFLKPIPE